LCGEDARILGQGPYSLSSFSLPGVRTPYLGYLANWSGLGLGCSGDWKFWKTHPHSAPQAGHANCTVISFEWIDRGNEKHNYVLHCTAEDGRRKTEEEKKRGEKRSPSSLFSEPSSCHMCRCISTCSSSAPKAFAV